MCKYLAQSLNIFCVADRWRDGGHSSVWRGGGGRHPLHCHDIQSGKQPVDRLWDAAWATISIRNHIPGEVRKNGFILTTESLKKSNFSKKTCCVFLVYIYYYCNLFSLKSKADSTITSSLNEKEPSLSFFC